MHDRNGRSILLLSVIVGLCGLGCPWPQSKFVCTSNGACVSEGVQGRCEPAGYCSFPDSACASGWRYGAFNPSQLAGMCSGVAGSGVGDGGALGDQGALGDGGGPSPCVAQVVSGGEHACARKMDGTIWCWGDDAFGQLGDGKTTMSQPLPVNMGASTLSGAVAVTAGQFHTCALGSDGSVSCWGYDNYGQLGNNMATSTPVSSPALTLGPGTATAIAGGGLHTCALHTDMTLACWGFDMNGQTGNPTHGCDSPNVCVGSAPCDGKPEPVVTNCSSATFANVSAIAAGQNHTCARVSDGTLWCWGDNGSGQLGSTGGGNVYYPAEVMNGASALAVTVFALGGSHTCAVGSDATVWCWGAGTDGQLGNGMMMDSAAPVQVLQPNGQKLSGVMAVTAGLNHSCAVRTDGTLWCWGANASGQLGDGSQTNRPRAVQVLLQSNGMALSGVLEVSGGYDFTCARTRSQVYCWGSNAYGQLGNGSTTSSMSTSSKAVPVSLTCP